MASSVLKTFLLYQVNDESRFDRKIEIRKYLREVFANTGFLNLFLSFGSVHFETIEIRL